MSIPYISLKPDAASCCTRLVLLWHLLKFPQNHMDIAIPADRDVVDEAAHIHIGHRLQLQETLDLPAVIAGDFPGAAAQLGCPGDLLQIQINCPQLFRVPGQLLL